MTLLSDSEIEQRLAGSAWQREGATIVRNWRFPNFLDAVAFVNAVADVAEAANHHPDIFLHGWNQVRLTLSTHSEGGVTESDFAAAEQIDRLS
ncbi:MAG TPA: 4a-hydroxytetrahydrobiopterin dehydratase [Solirubrobacteraceae bacterium]|nr:4a-hydroxytetrahydrobiopterin dehydratase [Solirubrobacteraceae bacterium]